ncbi:MAG: peptide MFS transporter [Thermoanaerobaculum sp.]|nr:peptide MFS transporter [Thermoanaerobaculum sp.]
MFKGHPSGLKVLFFTEMWERFGYYLMLGIFSLYMLDSVMGGLAFPREQAAETYGTFVALVYLTPFFGGVLADRVLGYRLSIVLGGLFMAAGYFCVAFGGLTLFYLGLGLVVVGNGFFKPNISTLVGKLYAEGSPLRDSGYNIFYMGINIGAFASNFVAALLRNRFGWPAAFAAAGVGMLLGVLIFLSLRKHLAQVPDRGSAAPVDADALRQIVVYILVPAGILGALGYFVIGPALGSPSTAAFTLGVLPALVYYGRLYLKAPAAEKGALGALLSIFLVVIVFWMIFHQNGSTMTYWADENTRREAGALAPVLRTLYFDQDATIGETIKDPDAQGSYWRNVPPERRPAPGEKVTLISTELFQSINPFFVVLLTPLLVSFWRLLRAQNREPSTPGKIAWGLAITSVSALVMVAAVVANAGGAEKASPWWLVWSYLLITVGELCLSPMGLSLVSRLAPARVGAAMMGGWFLATSIGNKLAGVLAGFWETLPIAAIFGINAGAAALAALAIALMTPRIRRIMEEHSRAS